ncbi:MAG: hypothetical protein HUU01_03865 [Saprospiraceae bacterium]|nr:hypothetical protein [Saprospiraceae bacterium]
MSRWFFLFMGFLWQLPSGMAQSCIAEAVALTDSVRVADALEDCLRTARQNNDVEAIVAGAGALAMHYRGNRLQQLSYWLEAERYLSKNADGTASHRQILQQIADVYRAEGIAGKALNYYQAAWNRLPGEQWTPERETLLNGIAAMYEQLNRPLDARISYEELLAYYTRTEQPQQVSRTLQQLAALSELTSQYTTARGYYTQLESLARRNAQLPELAAALNNIGYTYHRENKTEDAYRYFQLTYELRSFLSPREQLNLYHNLAIAAFNRNDADGALKKIEEARETLRPSEIERAKLDHLAAAICLRQGDFVRALRYFESARDKANKDRALLSQIYRTGADIHQARYELTQAIDYYQQHIRIEETLEAEAELRKREIDRQLAQMERKEKEIQLLLADQEVQALAIRQLQADNERIRINADKVALEAANRENDLRLLRQQQEINTIRLQNEQLAAQRTRSELKLASEELRSALAARNLAEVTQQEALRRLELEEKERDAARQIDLLNKDKAISELELERQRNFQRYAYLLGGALGLILLLIGGAWHLSRRNNRLLARKNHEVEAERHKSEVLLLNILPGETARELKETGQTTPRGYPEATVVFTDFSDFTNLASRMSPEELLAELNECFIRFDEIAESHGLEKIKVIGDSYMCVGGVPSPLPNHATAAVATALDMQAFIETRHREHLASGRPYWRMRVGIHTGPVVAGVVGKHKFSFDIWGDTVNLASRLEGAGEPGRINLSEETYALVKEAYQCDYRGELEVKGKGRVGMYFVR